MFDLTIPTAIVVLLFWRNVYHARKQYMQQYVLSKRGIKVTAHISTISLSFPSYIEYQFTALGSRANLPQLLVNGFIHKYGDKNHIILPNSLESMICQFYGNSNLNCFVRQRYEVNHSKLSDPDNIEIFYDPFNPKERNFPCQQRVWSRDWRSSAWLAFIFIILSCMFCYRQAMNKWESSQYSPIYFAIITFGIYSLFWFMALSYYNNRSWKAYINELNACKVKLD